MAEMQKSVGRGRETENALWFGRGHGSCKVGDGRRGVGPRLTIGLGPAVRMPKRSARGNAASLSDRARPARLKPRPARKLAPRYMADAMIHDEAALAAALDRLEAADPEVVGAMRAAAGMPPLRRRAPGLDGLVAIIVSQQVSVASARAIEARVARHLAPLCADTIRAADDDRLRLCGLSAPKMRTLRALAEAIATGGLDLDALAVMPPEEAHDRLVAVKGIGPWTADIFLLFCLGHPDAWPAGDLALQEAARLALGLKKRPDAKKLEKIAERWRPLRAVAARLLWAYYAACKRREGVGVA